MRTVSTLVYGPPGCGKTLYVQACFGELAKLDSSWMFVNLIASKILEKPEHRIRETFEGIDRFEVLGILIEDVDEVLGVLRQFPGAHRYFLEQVRQTEKERLLFATTCRPESLTAGELSSFSAILPILYPTVDERLRILQIHTKSVPVEPSVNLHNIATAMEWWSGREIKELIDQLISEGRDAIYERFINEAIMSIQDKIIIEQRINRMGDLVDFTMKHCNYRPALNETQLRYRGILDGKFKQEEAQKGIEELLKYHNRRLHELQKQRAIVGNLVDPRITIEIEDITEEIGKLQAKLDTLQSKWSV